jgi:hypothetical protein
MPTRNVNLADEKDRFVFSMREELEDEVRLAALRYAIDEGEASGVAAGGVYARVRRLAMGDLDPKGNTIF